MAAILAWKECRSLFVELSSRWAKGFNDLQVWGPRAALGSQLRQRCLHSRALGLTRWLESDSAGSCFFLPFRVVLVACLLRHHQVSISHLNLCR